MRDEKDPGTIEMTLRKKPGRPPKGASPKSDSERAAQYRLRRRHAATRRSTVRDPSGAADAVLLDALRIAVAESRYAAIWLITQELRDRYPSNS